MHIAWPLFLLDAKITIFAAMNHSKRLEDMSLEELWQLFPIELVAHRPIWSQWAVEESDFLRSLLHSYSPAISHIGSTAIPDIQAKPIIDVLVEIASDCNRAEIRGRMEKAGYICMAAGERRMSFNKGYTPDGYAEKVFHIHVHATGDNDEILFRDFLIANPYIAKEYEALKLSLLPKYRNNRDGYTAAKTDFVKRMVAAARKKL